jgi:hypothetical protein
MELYYILTHKYALNMKCLHSINYFNLFNPNINESGHIEYEWSCISYKWTDCTVRLENIEMKDVKVTVDACLQKWSEQFILRCINQLVYSQYSRLSLWKRNLFLTVSYICKAQCTNMFQLTKPHTVHNMDIPICPVCIQHSQSTRHITHSHI